MQPCDVPCWSLEKTVIVCPHVLVRRWTSIIAHMIVSGSEGVVSFNGAHTAVLESFTQCPCFRPRATLLPLYSWRPSWIMSMLHYRTLMAMIISDSSVLAFRSPWTADGRGYNTHTLYSISTAVSQDGRWHPESIYIPSNRTDTVALMVDNV